MKIQPQNESRKTIHYHGSLIRWWKARQRYKVDRYISTDKRIRQTFKTLAEAKLFAENKDNELLNKGHDALNISDKLRLDAVEAERILAGNVSLVKAARYYMKHEHPAGDIVTVSNLAEQYKAAMISRNARPHSVKGFEWRAKAFCRAYGEQSIQSISRADIETWLDKSGWQGLNRRHYIAIVRALFNHAIEKELIEANPADKIELPEMESKEPVILSAADISKLLHIAEDKEPAIVPALAISFFAGLRPVELARLDWPAIHLDGKEPVIHISAEVAKIRNRRLVDISPNLAAWLTYYRKLRGKVMLTLSNYRRHLARLLAETKIKLPYNAGRHAFASYAYVKHGAETTARWLGHADSELLLTTYKGLVTQSEADKFWDIMPKAEANIHRFKLAAANS